MMSVKMKKVFEQAKSTHSKLRADDKRFNGIVYVRDNHELTNLIYDHAFALIEGDYYMVFTEHYDFQVFAADEVELRQFKKENVSYKG